MIFTLKPEKEYMKKWRTKNFIQKVYNVSKSPILLDILTALNDDKCSSAEALEYVYKLSDEVIDYSNMRTF